MFCILLLLIGKTYRCKIGMNDAADMTDIIIVHLRTSPERSSYWKTDFVSVAETSKHEVKDNFNLVFFHIHSKFIQIFIIIKYVFCKILILFLSFLF